jgi:hypothetical protein
MNADMKRKFHALRGFVDRYQRLSAFICGQLF